MTTKKTVLVSSLDWGLGHASRTVPLVQKLLADQHTVIIACTKKQEIYFNEFFGDQVQYIKCPEYNITYSSILPLYLKIAIQFPKIILKSFLENLWLKKIVRQKNVEVVLSDNRFGMYNKEIRSIYLTHQIHVKTPLRFNLADYWHKKMIRNFSEVWIPDVENGLSGELSFPYPKKHPPHKYIGILSALKKVESYHKKSNQLLIILSGPEPQREILEKKLIEILPKINWSGEIIFVLGKQTGTIETSYKGNVKYFSRLSGQSLATLILESSLVICRSGYSTIMDLCVLESSGVLIPTPGQTEQEYLAHRLFLKYGIPYLNQDKITSLTLLEAIKKAMEIRFPRYENQYFSSNPLL